MPTYVVTASSGRLSGQQKSSLVSTITTVHSSEAQTPRCIVQVIFHEIQPGNHFINGKPVPSNDQIWIRGDIRGGRTDAQKESMLAGIVRGASEGTGIEEGFIWVYLLDVAGMAEFGSVMPQPGGEEEWLEGLPEGVKARYGFDG